MNLQEAVEELSRTIDEGEELPEGIPVNLWACPVALYLSEKTEQQVAVVSTFAWIRGERGTVRLPENVKNWIIRFDREKYE